jgi:hypothetical protein
MDAMQKVIADVQFVEQLVVVEVVAVENSWK